MYFYLNKEKINQNVLEKFGHLYIISDENLYTIGDENHGNLKKNNRK